MKPQSSPHLDGKRMCELAAKAAKTQNFEDELVEMFYALSKRLLNLDSQSIRRRFDFLDADDLMQEAVIRCFLVTKNFDETRLKRKQDAYFFFRAIIIQTYIRLHIWHSRQKRSPDQDIISLSTSKSNRVQDRLDRCNRKEYFSAGHDPDYYDLMEGAIEEIRRQRATGATCEEIAHEYDVEVETITYLVNGS